MESLHVVAKGGRRQCPPAIRATYPGSLPLPKGGPFSGSLPLVLHCSLLVTNEPWCAYHSFGLAKVCMESHPLENPYHLCQGRMYPYGIVPRYLPIICLEIDVVLTRQPAKPVVYLLGSTQLLG